MQLADTLDPVVDSLWIALSPADATDTLSYRNNDIIPTLKYQHDKSIRFLVIIVISRVSFKVGKCVLHPNSALAMM